MDWADVLTVEQSLTANSPGLLGSKPVGWTNLVQQEGSIVQKSSLTALAREQLELARTASSGRSASTVYGGHEHVLRQTVIALLSGRRLDEHANPGEATVHVLHGRVSLSAGDNAWTGSPGDLLVVPDARHSLEALEDSVVLLTVAKVPPTRSAAEASPSGQGA